MNTITINLDERIPQEHIIRLQENIHECIAQGVFNVKNGRAILHFDANGHLQVIGLDYIKWKRLQQKR